VARVLRPGAVTIEMLREVLPDDVERAPDSPAHAETAARAAPGLRSRHYAPRTPQVHNARGEGTRATLPPDTGAARGAGRAVGLQLTEEDRIALGALGAPLPDGRVWTLGEAADLAGIASRLYAALRELDAAGLDLILAAELPATGGLGFAIADRLRRAAHEHRTQNSEP
jgi:L-threonylcarbamoyladenylate synthase